MEASSPMKKSSPVRFTAHCENDTNCPNEALQPLEEARLDETMESWDYRPEDCNRWKGTIIIISTGLFCLLPIIGLLISAFTAVPGSDPGVDGIASEESTTMRAFTMGWMFCLSFKLRRELIGLAGSSSLLQPW